MNKFVNEKEGQGAHYKTRFTGIFIPVEILEMQELSFFEMFLLSWIDALYCPEHGGCFASNAYLAKKLGDVTESNIQKSLAKLRKSNLVEYVSFDGRKRVIRALIYRHVDKCHSEKSSNFHPRGGKISTPGLENFPPLVPPRPYYSYSKVRKDKTSPLARRLVLFFFEEISKINPKIRKPPSASWKKWEKEFDLMLSNDKHSEEDILKVIAYLVSTKDKPSSNGFHWCNVVLSAATFRKKFANLWGELHGSTPATSNSAEAAKKMSEKIIKKYPNHTDIVLGPDYLEFINGRQCEHIKFDDKKFKERVMRQLEIRKLKIE